MILRVALAAGLAALSALVTNGLVTAWISAADTRLQSLEAVTPDAEADVAIALAADEDYCTPQLKRVLRRVLTSCGLVGSGETRGCQPLEAKQVATLSGADFNDLFLPLQDRAGIIQFDRSKHEVDPKGRELLRDIFANQGGASYFFVVARASPDGDPATNRALSQKRGQAVLEVLQDDFKDPDLEKEVGLLWLGEEFAQLDEDFCDWNRSGGEDCTSAKLNRSAFVAWIDCRL